MKPNSTTLCRRQMLNSCTKPCLLHEEEVICNTFWPNPNKRKTRERWRDGRSCTKILNKPESSKMYVYFDVTKRKAAAILLHFFKFNHYFSTLFFFFSWNIFNIQMRFQPQWLIYNSFNPIFIKNKVAETEVRRPHMSNKHMYCNGKYFIQWILPTNVIR